MAKKKSSKKKKTAKKAAAKKVASKKKVSSTKKTAKKKAVKKMTAAKKASSSANKKTASKKKKTSAKAKKNAKEALKESKKSVAKKVEAKATQELSQEERLQEAFGKAKESAVGELSKGQIRQIEKMINEGSEWEAILKVLEDCAVPYNMRHKFSEKTAILHPKLGYGYVISTHNERSMKVYFESGLKNLVMNYNT